MNNKLVIEKWIDTKNINSIKFWNDIGVEDKFNIKSGNFSEFEKNIAYHNFIPDLDQCLKILKGLNKNIKGNGIELAAGTMWLTAHILRNFHEQLNEFYALEMSESLVLNLGIDVLNHYQVNTDKLKICIGSFYEINLPDKSLDFIVMCQAFHHADDPDRLLKEVARVLKKEGFLIMIGELFIPKSLYYKCYLNYLISKFCASNFIPSVIKNKIPLLKRLGSKNLNRSFQEIYFPSDLITGDHFYLKKQYEDFFRRNNFVYHNAHSKMNNHLSYILSKN